jgi:hypothetical protein
MEYRRKTEDWLWYLHVSKKQKKGTQTFERNIVRKIGNTVGIALEVHLESVLYRLVWVVASKSRVHTPRRWQETASGVATLGTTWTPSFWR